MAVMSERLQVWQQTWAGRLWANRCLRGFQEAGYPHIWRASGTWDVLGIVKLQLGEVSQFFGKYEGGGDHWTHTVNMQADAACGSVWPGHPDYVPMRGALD